MASKNSKRSKPRASNKKSSSREFGTNFGASDWVRSRELIQAAMRSSKKLATPFRQTSGDGASAGKNGAVDLPAQAALSRSKAELEEAIQRYVDVFDFAPVGYVTLDRTGRIEDINLNATKLFGRARNLLIGCPFSVLVNHEDTPLFLNHLLRCRSLEAHVETELRLKNAKQETIFAHISSTPTTSTTHGQAMLFQTAIVDLSERKRAEEALRESEEQNRAIVEQTTVGMARADRKGRTFFVNKAFCEMLGYEESELIGKTISTLTHPQERTQTAQAYKRLMQDGQPYEMEKRYIRKDGSVLWINVSASPVRDLRGKPQSAVAVVVDITARKKAEAALAKSREHLEELVAARTQALWETNVELQSEIERRKGLEGEILSIADREQQHLGQELHDGLCQQLAAIGLFAQATALRLKDHRVIQVEDIENITRLINDAVITARNISRDLHKEEVDAASLVQALQDLAKRKVWTVPCKFDQKTDILITDDGVAAELYRILREALVNANKHAKATRVVLEVARSNNELVFSVTDNGVGFSRKARRGRGIGFHIMQHRARSIGARLELESPRGGGARVVCRLPVS